MRNQRLLLSLVASLMAITTWADVAINESNFPDENFRNWLLRQSYGEDGILTDTEILTTRSLYPSSSNIQSLKGIEYFTALTYLDCGSNQLTSLDISKNTALTELNCRGNQLTSLDVSKNTVLTSLFCPSNQLTSLDVSKNTVLTSLFCPSNQLTSLDVSRNTALTSLDCSNNRLTSLGVSGCNALTSLNCYNNQIKGEAMDAFIESLPTNSWGSDLHVVFYMNEGNEMTSKQVEVAKSKGWKPKYAMDSYTWLDYEGCDIIPEGIEINETNFPDENLRNFLKEQGYGTDGVLTSAELSTITSLQVTYKNIKDLKGIEFFTSMTSLYCYNNQLTSLDLSKNTALRSLDCTGNQLTSLDLSKNTALTSLYCYSNRIKGEAMDALIASLPTITSGSSYDGRMQVINNSSERNMMTIDQVAAVKAKGWTPLYKAGSGYSDWQEYAGLDPTKIIEINETTFPDEGFRNWLLSQSYGEDGMLTDTEILTTTTMYVYSYYGSNIQSLKGIEYFTELTSLTCTNNSLTTIDLSKNTKLTNLECYSNQITGEGMDALIASLPVVSDGTLRINYYYNEGNEMSTAQATAAKAKGWIPQTYDSDTYSWIEYGGTDVDPSLLEKFPDAAFRKYLLSQSYGMDGVITDEEIATVTRIDVPYKKIKSLKGIEFFTALKMLDCSNNQLTELDLSKNTALTFLSCYNNQLTSLDLSKNTLLNDLDCTNNQLTSLNVSGCTLMEEFGCSNNQLTSLDLSGFAMLEEFGCHDNQLTSLNLSGCTALIELDCYNNQLKGASMDALIASLPTVRIGEMRVLSAYELMKALGHDVDSEGGNEMTLEQVVAAKAKGWIPYYENNYDWVEYIPNDPSGVGIAINETNFPDENFRNNILNTSYGADGVLTTLEASLVNIIEVSKQKIQSLKGIEYFTELKELNCGYNQIDTLDLSKNTKVSILECYDNGMTSLDVSECEQMIRLECMENKLTSLDVSKMSMLVDLYCSENLLTLLDVSNCAKLEDLECYTNKLTSIDVSKNPKLERLECHDNQLTSLDISNNPALKNLRIYKNKIKRAAMDILVNGLPTISNHKALRVIYNEGEGNEMTRSQVAIAIKKGWEPMYYGTSEYGYNTWMSYWGSDDDTPRGDVNGDGKVDMDDAIFVTNIILGTEDATKTADVNKDEEISMPDVMFIIHYIKNGKFPDE